MNAYFWEQCIKKHLREQKKQYLTKVSKNVKIYSDTSPEMLKLLIEMKRTLGETNG